jgi:hypothetical protein
MEHRVAERISAAERYLLNEFNDEERTDFEAHMFDCPICGEQVRQGAIAIENVKQVLREEAGLPEASRQSSRNQGWAAWFRMPALLPSALALALAAVVVYQNVAVIRGLERPQVLSSEVIAPLAREAAPVVVIDPRLPKFNLNFEVDGARAYGSYSCEFQLESGAVVLKLDCGTRQVASFTLALLLPTGTFPPDKYVMILRPAAEPQIEVGRYSFVIQLEDTQNVRAH